MKFSRRTDWSTETNALSALLARKRACGADVLDLTESNPTRCGFRILDARWLEPFSDPGNLKYEPDPRGLASAREAVCAYYAERGIGISPERIFLTSGTSEAYSHLLRLLTDSGDAVAVPAPGYPLFDYVLGLNDAVLLRYRSVYKNDGWRIGLPSLDDAAAECPRAFVVVNPNNPTGHFVTPDEREALNRACRRSSAALISDEVFLDFPVPGRDAGRSLADNRDTLTFTLSGVSKILGLPQMKLSWIAVSGPPDEVKAACEKLEVIADTYLSVGTPVQRALPEWLKRTRDAIRGISERVAVNRRALEAAVERTGMRALNSEGGWYAILESPAIRDEAFALRLLEEKNVYVHPGYFFDFEEESRVVVSLLPEPARFEAAVACLGGGGA